MLERQDIDNLALLSRLALSAKEKDELLVDLESILNYVSELSQVPMPTNLADQRLSVDYPLRNVLRADDDPFAGGQDSELILGQAPATKDNFLVVKKILDN